ncbi:MAG TPA: phosphoglycerate dehydrogenase [Verrucomicrobiae bacterium]|nr:phosphoglycerate dehydrogenase [Verrucomicrobiae bacterium]
MKILLTTTSFQDTPGSHHDLLASKGWEIITARGPLNEADTLALVGDIDGYICGDDAITRKVLEKALPKLKVISKYCIGVDKIDVKSCTEFGIPVLFTSGVNHTTVAEHTFLLLLALEKNLLYHCDSTRSGGWNRKTGHEILDKTMGIIGLGRIGKEVAIRAKAFGMKIIAYDPHTDPKFLAEHGITQMKTIENLIRQSDIVSLHMNLTDENRHLINAKRLQLFKKDAILLNCSRGELVDTNDIAAALKAGQLGGYGTDVLDHEPPAADHPLLKLPNCIVTPHIASRTYESVVRQATCAVENLILAMNGEKPIAQVNPEVPVKKVV